MYQLENINPSSAAEWNAVIQRLPQAHILQTHEWATLKYENGWRPLFYTWKDATGEIVAAVCLHRKEIPVLRLCILYAPRGPLLDWQNALLRQTVMKDLVAIARRQRALFIKIDPEVSADAEIEGSEELTGLLKSSGWSFSRDQLQFRNTILLDITPDEDGILAGFKQKTRYNIRLADKKGVVVRPGTAADLPALYLMYAQTALRDGFAIRSREYYLQVWSTLMEAGKAYPLIAEVDGEMVSALVMFVFARRAYYFYGMSSGKYREWMPNHLLQWRAITLAKSLGCTQYDFWGAPDQFDPGDSMYGVYRFKEGFNGQIFKGIGAWDFPVHPLLYRLYGNTLPVILGWMRRVGRRRIKQETAQ